MEKIEESNLNKDIEKKDTPSKMKTKKTKHMQQEIRY